MARIVRFHQYGDKSVLKIEDLDVPSPAADEVQIEVKSIGHRSTLQAACVSVRLSHGRK